MKSHSEGYTRVCQLYFRANGAKSKKKPVMCQCQYAEERDNDVVVIKRDSSGIFLLISNLSESPEKASIQNVP